MQQNQLNQSDHDTLLLIARDVADIKDRLVMVEDDSDQEAELCVFHPSRQQNGNSILKRMDTVEREIIRAKWFAAGLGLVNIAALVKEWMFR